MREITLMPVSEASEQYTGSPRTSQVVRSISQSTDLTANTNNSYFPPKYSHNPGYYRPNLFEHGLVTVENICFERTKFSYSSVHKRFIIWQGTRVWPSNPSKVNKDIQDSQIKDFSVNQQIFTATIRNPFRKAAIEVAQLSITDNITKPVKRWSKRNLVQVQFWFMWMDQFCLASVWLWWRSFQQWFSFILTCFKLKKKHFK